LVGAVEVSGDAAGFEAATVAGLWLVLLMEAASAPVVAAKTSAMAVPAKIRS
jgi:hypothetical protein